MILVNKWEKEEEIKMSCLSSPYLLNFGESILLKIVVGSKVQFLSQFSILVMLRSRSWLKLISGLLNASNTHFNFPYTKLRPD